MSNIIFFTIFISFVVGINPIFAEISYEQESLFYEAVSLEKKGDLENALVKLRQFLKLNPDAMEARTNECGYLLELNRLLDAEKCIESVFVLYPENYDNMNNLGILYSLREDYDSAKTQFSLTHKMYPNNITAYANLLATRVLLGDNIEEILVEHKQLLEKDEFNVQVLSNIGKLLYDQKNFDESKIFLDRAYGLDDRDIDVLVHLGSWYSLKNDLLNGEKYFLLAYEQDSEDISVLNNLGLLYRDLGDEFHDRGYYQESIKFYKAVQAQDNENVFAKQGIDYSTEKILDIDLENFYFNVGLLIVGILAVIISLIIGLYFSYKQDSVLQQLEKDPEILESRGRKILSSKISTIALIGGLSIPVVLLTITLGYKIPLKDEWDVANWTTMVVEVGIGILVAVMILVYDQSKKDRFDKQQREISKIVMDIKKIEEKQEKSIEEQHTILLSEQEKIHRWKKDWGSKILGEIESIKKMFEILEKWLIEYKQDPSTQNKTNIIGSAKRIGDIVDYNFKNIEKYIPKIEKFFEDPTLGTQLLSISEQFTVIFQSMERDYHWESDLKTAHQIIDERKSSLIKFIERLKKEIPLHEE